MRSVSKIRRVLPLAGCLAGLAPAAQAADCGDAVRAAQVAQVTTPFDSRITITPPGQAARRAEMVFTGSRIYVLRDGRWTSAPLTAEAAERKLNDEIAARLQSATETCEPAGTEAVDGESATIYRLRDVDAKDPAQVTETRIWVAGRTGRVLMSETRTPAGARVAQHLRYDGVEPPPGVK